MVSFTIFLHYYYIRKLLTGIQKSKVIYQTSINKIINNKMYKC